MGLSILQYAELLDKTQEPCPAGPALEPFDKAKPHLKVMPGIRCVIWSGYGTLLHLVGGELQLLNPDPIMKKVSLDKTLHKFNMWQSMSRKPGEPAAYLEAMFDSAITKLKNKQFGKRDFELKIQDIWRIILDQLNQKEYSYDATIYGTKDEFAEKIAYFYLRASQGASIDPNLHDTLRQLVQMGVLQGIHANGQFTSPIQLFRLLGLQGSAPTPMELFDPTLCHWSYLMGFKKESTVGMTTLMKSLADRRLEPDSVLYLSAHLDRDLVPAKRRGMRTAILLADRQTTPITPDQLKDPQKRPDLLLTNIRQLLDVLAR